MAMWQEEIETMPREELKKLQGERLCWQVKRMYERVELFRNRMDELGLKPEDIKGLEDLSKLPFSYKNDLRDYYPYGLFAEDMKNIVRVHASSGTTGKKIVVGYTENDMTMWKNCMARMLTALDIGKEDVAQISFGYGLFTGGLGAHDGASHVGATVVPISSGNTKNQLQTMEDFGSTVLFCTPSYALYLAEAANEAGIVDRLKLKICICGAEPWTDDMRVALEKELKVKAYDIYGLSEIMGPGVAYECKEQAGMHVCEDNFIVEIVDPETGEQLPEGSIGELVFSTITKEGFPILRYRTHDIGQLITEPCKCGRTHIRMKKPMGRTDDMLIIRGVNVFPSQIEEVLLKVSGDITPNYQIVVDRINNNDTFEVNVEMSEALFADDVKSIEKVEKEIKDRLHDVLGLKVDVHLVNPKTIARSEGKAKRIIDKRKLS